MKAEDYSCSSIRQIRVPGKGDVPIQLSIHLLARHRGDGRDVSLQAPPLPEQTVDFPQGIGRVRLQLEERIESDGSLCLRLRCEAKLGEDWVLYEATLAFAAEISDWKVVLPSGLGLEVADVPPDLDFVGIYPGYSALAQLVILQGPSGGLSVCARDADLELKEIRARLADITGRERLVIEIARVPVKHADLWRICGECDILLSAHNGGWDAAASDYRRRQEQVRPELKTPRLLHPLLEADPVWLTQNCFAFPPHTVAETIAVAGRLGVPTMCHFYDWQDAPFDTRYPDWTGFRAEAISQIEALEAAGIPSVPYTNARLWDTTTESWRQSGKKCAVRDFRGQPETETYPTSKIELGVACPSQTAYHDKLANICQALADSGCNFPGIYLDQIGAAYGRRCYASNHGHPLGASKSWNRGQRAMVRRIRDMLTGKLGPCPILTIENASEPMVDMLDGFLIYCDDASPGRQVPLWQAIYGDFGTTYGGYFDKVLDLVDGKPSPGMRGLLGRQAIYGSAMGWLSPQCLTGAYEPVADFIRRARAERLPIRSFFRTGRLCAETLDTTGQITGVFQSAWRREDKTVALAANPAETRVDFTWPDGAGDTLKPYSAKSRRLD